MILLYRKLHIYALFLVPINSRITKRYTGVRIWSYQAISSIMQFPLCLLAVPPLSHLLIPTGPSFSNEGNLSFLISSLVHFLLFFHSVWEPWTVAGYWNIQHRGFKTSWHLCSVISVPSLDPWWFLAWYEIVVLSCHLVCHFSCNQSHFLHLLYHPTLLPHVRFLCNPRLPPSSLYDIYIA